MSNGINKAKKLSKAFHKSKVIEVTSDNFKIPEALVKLGYVHAVVYTADKNGKDQSFVHDFRSPCELFTDESGKRLFITGKKLKVTGRGIIG